MSLRTRKLFGGLVLVVFVILYALLAMALLARFLPGAPLVLQGLGYLGAGLLWVLPAGLLVRWILRPRD